MASAFCVALDLVGRFTSTPSRPERYFCTLHVHADELVPLGAGRCAHQLLDELRSRTCFLGALRHGNRCRASIRVELAIPRIKFALIKPLWGETEEGWGAPPEFEQWLKDGESDPPPSTITQAVEYYHYARREAKP